MKSLTFAVLIQPVCVSVVTRELRAASDAREPVHVSAHIGVRGRRHVPGAVRFGRPHRSAACAGFYPLGGSV